jgi:hypothetical protein
MPRPPLPVPRAYGRQAEGRTLKTLSISNDLLPQAERAARAARLDFSGWISGVLAGAVRR